MNQVLYLVRHCQATGQEPDAPLTETGKQQAIALADWLSKAPIGRIISSPFTRAHQSIRPLSERLELTIEIDERLSERILSSVPLDDWRKRLAETFVDLDLSFEGGESSRTAMMRGVAVVHQAMQETVNSIAIVTHGNLMTLILKYFSEQVGYTEWEKLQNPDVYRVTFSSKGTIVEHFRFEGTLQDQGDWAGVPDEHQAEWQRIFQESQESLNLSAPCPICGVVALHRWYQIGESIDRVIEGREFVATGGLWEWCSSCHCFEHYSGLVPEWWSCDLEVEFKLRNSQSFLIAAFVYLLPLLTAAKGSISVAAVFCCL